MSGPRIPGQRRRLPGGAGEVNRAGEIMSLEAVGAALGITRERVRQIEVRAIEKLRDALAARGLTPDDLLRDRPDFGFVVKQIHRSQ